MWDNLGANSFLFILLINLTCFFLYNKDERFELQTPWSLIHIICKLRYARFGIFLDMMMTSYYNTLYRFYMDIYAKINTMIYCHVYMKGLFGWGWPHGIEFRLWGHACTTPYLRQLDIKILENLVIDSNSLSILRL